MFWIAKLITHITIHANLRPRLFQPHPGQFFSSKTTNESITISEPPQHHLNSPNVTSSWMLWSGCWMKQKIKIDVLFWKKSLKIVCVWFPAVAWAFWWSCVNICNCICIWNWEEWEATGGSSLMGWCSKKFFLTEGYHSTIRTSPSLEILNRIWGYLCPDLQGIYSCENVQSVLNRGCSRGSFVVCEKINVFPICPVPFISTKLSVRK